MATIVVDNLVKRFGANAVVNQLSFDIREGEFVSLLGPSGCGKTTTLRMLAGLEHPDSGRIDIGGVTVFGPRTTVAPEKRNVGMVFQSYAIWPHKTVGENVAYPLKLRKVGNAEIAIRVAEALRWVRLDSFEDRTPQSLSGGQLQRVALARALVMSPRVLLLDEPLSNLDAALREELRAEIAALRARLHTTMVFVTHDQSEALSLSDRIAVMNRGRLEQFAAPMEIYEEPATEFVASFVSNANLLVGEVKNGYFCFRGMRFPVPSDIRSGRGTLSVRPQDFRFGESGLPVEVSAKLFLGQLVEWRCNAGEQAIRVIGPPLNVSAGEHVNLEVVRARFFAAE